ncbi:TonB family protein [Methylobacterium brachythecii]|nr:TonB family protein [Methylobacterium brachythecii]
MFAGAASTVRAENIPWPIKVSNHIRPFGDARKPDKMPRGRHTALIKMTIDRIGRVTNPVVARSSGKPNLDAIALAAVRAASPVPAIPSNIPGDAEDEITATLPISFDSSAKPRRVSGVANRCRNC